MLHLFSVWRILFDPGQAQVEQGFAVGRGILQRLHGVFVALLLDQRLHQQRPCFIVSWYLTQQVTHQPFDFLPVAVFASR